jgi:hypothetical protein
MGRKAFPAPGAPADETAVEMPPRRRPEQSSASCFHGFTLPSPRPRPGFEEARMPAEPFSVRINRDDLAKLDLAGGLSQPSQTDEGDSPPPAAALDAAHHGARDDRQAARRRSERDRSGRATGAASSRSYAFRRS